MCHGDTAMTMDGLQPDGCLTLTDRATFIGTCAIVVALATPGFAQNPVVDHLRVAHMNGVRSEYVPDMSCELRFQGGGLSEYDYSISLWDDYYCGRRKPHRRSSCRSAGRCCPRSVPHAYSSSPSIHLHRATEGGGVVGNPNMIVNPYVPAVKVPPFKVPAERRVTAPTTVQTPTQPSPPEISPSHPIIPPAPVAPENSPRISAPESIPPDFEDEMLEPAAPVIPPEPADVPHVPPVPELPKNQLPTLSATPTHESIIAPMPVSVLSPASGNVSQRDSLLPPIPIAFESQPSVRNRGTSRLIDYLQRQ